MTRRMRHQTSPVDLVRGIRGDIRATVMELIGEGWQPIRWTSGGHLLLEHPSGARCSASCSSSDRNGCRMLRRQARRALADATASRDGTLPA